MQTKLPSIQKSCKKARRIIKYRASAARDDKRTANRRHRRKLNSITKSFERDVESFDDECFEAPSFSSWDIC